jgi:hypothetical protein
LNGFQNNEQSRKEQMEQIFHFETNGGPKKHIRFQWQKKMGCVRVATKGFYRPVSVMFGQTRTKGGNKYNKNFNYSI